MVFKTAWKLTLTQIYDNHRMKGSYFISDPLVENYFRNYIFHLSDKIYSNKHVEK